MTRASDDTPDDVLARVQRYFGLDTEDADAGASRPPGDPAGERYLIHERLGEGGMGVVFRSFDRDLRRDVALKVTKPGRSELRDRFVSEAQLTGQLEHPNIVPVHELGTDAEGRRFFTMKKVDGRTLKEVVDALGRGDSATQGEFSIKRLLHVVLKVCDAISFAHSRGVVHRDLKPANIMVGTFGEVLVMDWGLAKLLAEPDAAACGGSPSISDELDTGSVVGAVLGSPAFMAPEQARGEHQAIDVRTDVFGIGAVLYYVLTGQPPHRGSERHALLEQAQQGMVSDPLLGASARGVPRELRGVVRKAMAPDQGDRYATVTDLAADLTAHLDGRPGSAWHDPLPSRLAKLARRQPARATAAAAVVVVAFAGLLAWSQYRSAESEARLREFETERRVTAERAEKNRIFLTRLSRVREGRSEFGTLVTSEDFAAVHAYLAAYRDHGLPLDDDRQLGEVLAALRDAEGGEEVREGIRVGLDALTDQMLRCGIPFAWLMTRSAPPPWSDEVRRGRWSRVAQEHPDLVAFWPRLEGIVGQHDDDPWRREVRKVWRSRWLFAKEAFTELLEREDFEDRSASDLEWLAVVVMHAVDDKARAVPVLARAIELDPSRFWARLYRAKVAHRDRDFSTARLHAEVAVGLRGDSAAARVQLAAALMGLEDYAAVVHHCEEAIARRPGSALAHTNLGAAFERLGRRSEALAAHRRAARVGPNLWLVHYNLGTACMRYKRFGEAEAALRRAVELWPENPEALWNLGIVLRESAYFAEALHHLVRADELGVARGNWRGDSQAKIRDVERRAERARPILDVVGGAAPASPRQALQAANLAVRREQFHVATRLYEAAFAGDSSFVDDTSRGYRYGAACSAALAGCGRGRDGADLSAVERVRMRGRALQWLRVGVAHWRRQLDSGNSLTPMEQTVLRHMPAEDALSGVRGAQLAELPADEAEDWRQLWSDVGSLVERL